MTNIYFLSDGNNIKIGKSKNLNIRKNQLQIGNANNLRLLYILENVEDYTEKQIHDLCNLYNIRGEWFDNEVLNFILNLPWYKENIKRV